MEFTIRTLVVIVMIVIAFVVLVALIANWGGESGNALKSLSDWFNRLITGQEKPPFGQTQQNPTTGGKTTGSGSSGIPPIIG